MMYFVKKRDEHQSLKFRAEQQQKNMTGIILDVESNQWNELEDSETRVEASVKPE